MNAISSWLASVALLPWSGCALAQTYTLTDVGTLGGNYSFGNAISSNGLVTGYASTPGDGADYAFLYSNGTITNLGSLGGISSAGWGVNSSGQVVGYSYGSDINPSLPNAFLYSNGTMTGISTPSNVISYATAINDAGHYVAYFGPVGEDTATTNLYSNGTVTDIGSLGTSNTFGTAINNAGQVAGNGLVSRTTPLFDYAFVYSNGQIMNLGAPAVAGGIVVTGVNNVGQLAGWNPGGVNDHAFIYTKGAWSDLGTLSGANNSASYATGINDAGQVVGYSTTGAGQPHAFLYSKGKMIDLNSETTGALAMYVTLTEATGINDAGQIVADGIDSRTGHTHAYLLQPVLLPDAQLAALLTEVTGVGPGKSLANKVKLAQTYYAAKDVQATCAMLTAFLNEAQAQNGKKIDQKLDAKLIADADAIEVAIGCQ